MSYLRRFILWFIFLAISIGLAGLGPKEVVAGYPEKPITIIVPFGAGGGFDTLARALAVRLEKELKSTFVVLSRPGAGGRRGSVTLYKSKPDGYTVGFAHYTPFLSDEILLDRKSSINYKKFAVVLKVSQSKHFIFATKNTPYKSLSDLKDAGRPIKFAATGIGAITWVEGSAVGATVGFPVSFVTGYRSLPVAALAAARGDAEAGIGGYTHIRGVLDDIRPLVYLGKERDSNLPDVE